MSGRHKVAVLESRAQTTSCQMFTSLLQSKILSFYVVIFASARIVFVWYVINKAITILSAKCDYSSSIVSYFGWLECWWHDIIQRWKSAIQKELVKHHGSYASLRSNESFVILLNFFLESGLKVWRQSALRRDFLAIKKYLHLVERWGLSVVEVSVTPSLDSISSRWVLVYF